MWARPVVADAELVEEEGVVSGELVCPHEEPVDGGGGVLPNLLGGPARRRLLKRGGVHIDLAHGVRGRLAVVDFPGGGGEKH